MLRLRHLAALPAILLGLSAAPAAAAPAPTPAPPSATAHAAGVASARSCTPGQPTRRTGRWRPGRSCS